MSEHKRLSSARLAEIRGAINSGHGLHFSLEDLLAHIDALEQEIDQLTAEATARAEQVKVALKSAWAERDRLQGQVAVLLNIADRARPYVQDALSGQESEAEAWLLRDIDRTLAEMEAANA